MITTNNRQYRIDVFNDSQTKINESEKIKSSLAKSLSKQKFYEDASKIEIAKNEAALKSTKIHVTKNKTMEAGRFWSKHGNTAVHNFASATHPGGGVTGGSAAQEECLCRVSTLYNCLTDTSCHANFYGPNIDEANVLHNNKIIYTPKVCVFKDDDYKMLSEKEYFYVDVITCAAPNLRDVPNNGWCNNGESNNPATISSDELYKIHVSRAKAIFNTALDNKISNIVVGAFGCGAFRNDPNVVAKAYKDVIKDYMGLFENIEFAVYCNSYDTQNYEIFRNTLLK